MPARFPRRGRGLKAVLVALVSALILASCANPPNGGSGGEGGSGGSGNANGSGASGRGVTFAGVFCVCFANAYVAWKEGFFEEEGVKIDEFVMTAGGADTFSALAGGDAEFGLSGLDAIMRGIETNIDVRAVATVSPEFYALSVRKELAGDIQDVADLEGRQVSVSKIGSASWAFLKLLLEEEGMNEDDVKVVQLGGIDTTMAGLKRGTVDAAITWEPGSSQGVAQGFSEILVNSLDPADHEAIYGSDASISMTLAVKQQLIESDPELVQGAIRALDKANAWMASHSAEEIADVLQPMAAGLDRELLVASIENTMATMPETVAVSEAAYEDSAARLKDADIVKDVPPVDAVFDCELAECVE
jgi:NitT/TauT family transport system substrate-binding protein